MSLETARRAFLRASLTWSEWAGGTSVNHGHAWHRNCTVPLDYYWHTPHCASPLTSAHSSSQQATENTRRTLSGPQRGRCAPVQNATSRGAEAVRRPEDWALFLYVSKKNTHDNAHVMFSEDTQRVTFRDVSERAHSTTQQANRFLPLSLSLRRHYLCPHTPRTVTFNTVVPVDGDHHHYYHYYRAISSCHCHHGESFLNSFKLISILLQTDKWWFPNIGFPTQKGGIWETGYRGGNVYHFLEQVRNQINVEILL